MKTNLIVPIVSLLAIGETCFGDVSLKVFDLICEYKTNPIGIDVTQPRMSWKIGSSERDVQQTAYHIRTAESPDDLITAKNLHWETDNVKSDQSTHVAYSGPFLTSRQKIWWQVRVWDNKGNLSDWSEPAWWEMGLLKPEDWVAGWVEPDLTEEEHGSNPCPMLRRQFEIDREIKHASRLRHLPWSL